MCLGKFPRYVYEGGRVVGSCVIAVETPLFHLHLQLLAQIILNHLTTDLIDRLVTQCIPCWLQNQHDVRRDDGEQHQVFCYVFIDLN